jgi:hypothetical protein
MEGSASPMTYSIIRPLSIGNVVSAGLGLYRSHLKAYLGLSTKAHLWSLIPIYGWSKYQTMSASIARHAFQELICQPESLRQSEQQVNPHLWLFFALQMLVLVLLVAINMALSLVQFIGLTIPLSLLVDILGEVGGLLLLPMQIIINLVFYGIYLWFWSRLFIPEMPLAIDAQTDVIDNIGRSWSLTQGSGIRILIVISVVFVITIPLYLLALSPAMILLGTALPLAISAIEESVSFAIFFALFMLALLVGIVMLFVVSIFVMPIWQAIKSIIYYDLRSRREGLGLQLRDRTI